MRRRAHKAFTLTELLIVIGIIVVLMVIVTVGLRTVVDTAARHETAAELKVCVDLLREYQGINGLNGIEGPPGPPMTDDQQLKLPNPPFLNRWYSLPIYTDQSSEVVGQAQGTALGLADFAGSRTKHPGDPPYPGDTGDMSDRGDLNNPRWVCRGLYNTQGIMFLLLKNPTNRAIVSGLPPKRILETWPRNRPTDPPQAPFTLDAAVPLDGWGNPIIYVPRGGMHVWMNPTNSSNPTNSKILMEYIVRSSGTYLVTGSAPPPVGPNDRPFFASAGHDCYFNDLTMTSDRAIDNLYSFQEQ